MKVEISLTQCARLLTALIAADTQNPPGNEEALADTILAWLKPYAPACRKIPVAAGRSSLVLEIPGQDPGRVLALAGHMDTVPAGDRRAWYIDPLTACIQGHALTGRGAVDMKGGLCAMLLLYVWLRENAVTPPCTLRFLFTADEESGGLGIRAVREVGLLDDVGFLLVCEPTANRLGTCEMGTLWYKITVSGRSCHASMAENGVNALEYSMLLAEKIRGYFTALPSHPLLGTACARVTRLQGGIKTNIIPDCAVMEMDLRTVPVPGARHETIDSWVGDQIQSLTARVPGLSIRLEKINDRPALQTATGKLTGLQSVMQSLQMNPAPVGVRFFTDASIAVPGMALPFAICGPGDPQQCHTANETTDLRQVQKAFALYRSFALQYGKTI